MVEAVLLQEDRWLDLLEGVPRWTPPAKDIVIIAPHPDDETLCAAGLMAFQRQQERRVSVVAVSDGEAAYPDRADLGIIRQREQEEAVKVLGIADTEVIRLRLPDTGLQAYEKQMAERIAPLVNGGTLLVAPWPSDWHPDHEACGMAMQEVSRKTGAELIFYLFWSWHRKDADALANQPLVRFELDSSLRTLKEAALQCHRSQLEREEGLPILPKTFLAPARRSFEIFILNGNGND